MTAMTPPVLIGRFGQVELREHLPDVGLDRPLRHEQAGCDGAVGHALQLTDIVPDDPFARTAWGGKPWTRIR